MKRVACCGIGVTIVLWSVHAVASWCDVDQTGTAAAFPVASLTSLEPIEVSDVSVDRVEVVMSGSNTSTQYTITNQGPAQVLTVALPIIAGQDDTECGPLVQAPVTSIIAIDGQAIEGTLVQLSTVWDEETQDEFPGLDDDLAWQIRSDYLHVVDVELASGQSVGISHDLSSRFSRHDSPSSFSREHFEVRWPARGLQYWGNNAPAEVTWQLEPIYPSHCAATSQQGATFDEDSHRLTWTGQLDIVVDAHWAGLFAVWEPQGPVDETLLADDLDGEPYAPYYHANYDGNLAEVIDATDDTTLELLYQPLIDRFHARNSASLSDEELYCHELHVSEFVELIDRWWDRSGTDEGPLYWLGRRAASPLTPAAFSWPWLMIALDDELTEREIEHTSLSD